MSAPALLCLLGFTPFEERSFAAYIELGDPHGAGYELTDDLRRAQCIVADADDAEAMVSLQRAGLLERTVVLGATPCAGAALQLPRPINLLLVVRALDTIVGARPRAGARLETTPDDPPPMRARPTRAPEPTADAGASFTSLTAPPWPQQAQDKHVQRVLDELAARTVTLPAHLDVRAMAAEGTPSRRAAAKRSGSGRPLPLEHILVIDNDANTLRLIAVQLQRFGFQVHLAGHPQDALRLLTRRFHDYVFMDPALAGLDALLVCRLARQTTSTDGNRTTSVVLVADPASPAAPLERALPAADACLKKPISPQALLEFVGEREVSRYAYADTARTTTLI